MQAGFSNNQMKLNTDKCHLLWISQEPNTLNIAYLHINNSLSEKLLGINFDCKLQTHRRYLPKIILGMVYYDKDLTFNELYEKYGPVSIYHQNLQKLAVEMFKFKSWNQQWNIRI